MAIRKVLRAGYPSLREENEPYPESSIGSDEFVLLVNDMFETMHEYDGVGLAAPQVQKNVRIIVYEIRENERYEQIEETVEPTVMVNPEILSRSDDREDDWEGCLSLPDLRGRVPRSKQIEVEYLNRDGKTVNERYEGFEARVIQHEVDHLEGKLFVERMEDMESFCFLEEYRRFQCDKQSDEDE